MMRHSIVSSLVSGLLCALPFIEPIYLWPLIFLFPLPLFFNQTTITKSPFLNGFCWGLVSLSIQLSGINSALLSITHGLIVIRIIIPILLVCIQVIVPALLFFLGSKIIERYQMNNRSIIAIQSFILILFFLYFEYACLWFTGTIEGYSLMHPLIPLMHIPLFRLMLLHTNHMIMLLCIVGFPTIIAISWGQMKKDFLHYALYCGMFFVLLSATLFKPHPTTAPSWVSKIVALPFVFYIPHNMTFLMYAVAHELKKVVQKYPNTALVVMPESSLYCSFLHLSELTSLLSQKEVSKPIHLIAGSFSFSNNQYHNALYWIDNGNLKTCYYKRHTMFLTERIPLWLRKTFVEKIFFSQSPIITQSKNERPLLKINDEITLIPYICSELFFNHKPDDAFEQSPILAIANDRHFLPYISDLMVRHAQRIAISWKRPIVYVSFLHHVYIDTDGCLFQLIV